MPVPWDEGHVFYVWYDALINYATAVGYGTDHERFDAWWPAVHHLIGKDILRFHCVYWPAMLLAAGDRAAAASARARLPARGRREDEQDAASTRSSPADLVADFGVDGFRYHFLRDTPFGPDGDFSYEAMVARYNTDLANNLGNLLSRVATVVAKKCDGIGPAPRPDSPLAAVAAEVYATAAAAWDAVQPSVALEATWRLIREANAHLEANEPWKAEPGPEVDARARRRARGAAHRRHPRQPGDARGDRDEIWRRIGLTVRPADQRLPGGRGLGRLSRRPRRSTKGDAAVPPPQGMSG